MCPFCFGRSPGRATIFSPARFADFAERTHATLLYANALVCLGGGFEPTACRPCQRTSFESLVGVSRSFVAEFKDARKDDGPDQLTVALQYTNLFFELFRRARDLVAPARDSDRPDEVNWTLERGRCLAAALANLAGLAGGPHFGFEDAKRALTDLAGLIADVCEAQVAATGAGPPEWDPESPAYRADRLAVFLYDAVEQLDIASRRRPQTLY